MGWSVPPTKRSCACRFEYLKQLREQRGWTQEDLAEASGYSPRLIRKAESGAGISPGTIDDLATALSTVDRPVFPEDLVSDPLADARLLLHCYDEYEREMLSHCAHILSDDVVFWCAGDPQEMPIAVSYQGLAGFQEFLDRFFTVFSRPKTKPFQPTFVLAGNEVVARYEEVTAVNGIAGPALWIVNISQFQRGKIVRIENYFDTETGQKQYSDPRNRA